MALTNNNPLLDNNTTGNNNTASVDLVNNPPHYKDGGIETIDFIESKSLCYHLGNVVKYISRAGKKDPTTELQDLEKAQWYLNRKIEQVKPKKRK